MNNHNKLPSCHVNHQPSSYDKNDIQCLKFYLERTPDFANEINVTRSPAVLGFNLTTFQDNMPYHGNFRHIHELPPKLPPIAYYHDELVQKHPNFAISHPLTYYEDHRYRDTTAQYNEQERRRIRLERNRQAAKQCRDRKKAYLSNLELRGMRLEDENQALKKAVHNAREKLNAMSEGTIGNQI
ncbi:hypothetical protein G9A89_009188 [Geosiphon pyriformis]|nr:hypothetical protein G9A89_009188 [Geosiphon pyriformis]